jgi:16S rRNA (guanine(527)-N(7))-methyltransferase RsmG
VKQSQIGGASRVSRETNIEKLPNEVRERVARWLSGTTLRPSDGFLERIEKMAAALALWGAHTNLTAAASDPSEIAFHVIDSIAPVAFAAGAAREALELALAKDATVLDLGSGGGFPGLVLAAAFAARFTLAEARRKRASYLQVAAHEMNLANVEVERRRASAESIASGFDLVTARAFGTSVELYEIAAAALRPAGILLLYASADQVLDGGSANALAEGSEAAAKQHFADRITWTYRLPHGELVAARTAVLWRKSSTSPYRSLKRR